MKPNIEFIHENGQFRIYHPLNPPILGGLSIHETFVIAINRLFISKREKVRIYQGDGTKGRFEDIDFEDYSWRQENAAKWDKYEAENGRVSLLK